MGKKVKGKTNGVISEYAHEGPLSESIERCLRGNCARKEEEIFVYVTDKVGIRFNPREIQNAIHSFLEEKPVKKTILYQL